MENNIINPDKKNMVHGVVFDNSVYDHFENGINRAIKASYNVPTKLHDQYVYHTQIRADAEVANYVYIRLKSIKDTIIYSIKSIIASLLKTSFDNLNTLQETNCFPINEHILIREYVENAVYVKDKRELNNRFITAFYSYLSIEFVGEIYTDIMNNARAYIYSNPNNVDLFSENPTCTYLDNVYTYVHNIVSGLIHTKFDEYADELTYITKYIIDAYANVYVERDSSNGNGPLNFDDEF